MSIVTNSWNWATATPKRNKITKFLVAIALVLLVPALWLGWWLGSPLFLDDVSNEEFPLTASATIPENVTQNEAESMMETAAKLESSMDEPMDDEMTKSSTISLKTGSFRDEDRLHKGSGNATIYRLEDS